MCTLNPHPCRKRKDGAPAKSKPLIVEGGWRNIISPPAFISWKAREGSTLALQAAEKVRVIDFRSTATLGCVVLAALNKGTQPRVAVLPAKSNPVNRWRHSGVLSSRHERSPTGERVRPTHPPGRFQQIPDRARVSRRVRLRRVR